MILHGSRSAPGHNGKVDFTAICSGSSPAQLNGLRSQRVAAHILNILVEPAERLVNKLFVPIHRCRQNLLREEATSGSAAVASNRFVKLGGRQCRSGGFLSPERMTASVPQFIGGEEPEGVQWRLAK